MGALTFAFVDPADAKYWVEEYYATFKSECEPIGRTVNPNVAMVTGFMCHPDSDVAVARGLEGFQFFGYALSHYYITGTHVPGRFNIWDDFKRRGPQWSGPTGGIGNPDQVREQMEKFEATGVDQVIFIQQGGRNQHEHICEALQLFATDVMPPFKERHADRQRRKAAELAPHIERAMSRIPPLDDAVAVEPIDSYPVMMQKAHMPIDEQTIGKRLAASVSASS
jgi:hypothetical protein